MLKQKYYAVTTKMTFEKTVLIPVECVKDMEDAIDMGECAVETASIDLLNSDADCETIPSPYADKDGIMELSEEESAAYQTVKRDIYKVLTYKNLDPDSDEDMSFTVPEEWAEEWCKKNGFSHEAFSLDYTYDETLQMYHDAEDEDMLLFVSEDVTTTCGKDSLYILCTRAEREGELELSVQTVEYGCHAEAYNFKFIDPKETSEEEIKKAWQKMKIIGSILSCKENLPLRIYDESKKSK